MPGFLPIRLQNFLHRWQPGLRTLQIISELNAAPCLVQGAVLLSMQKERLEYMLIHKMRLDDNMAVLDINSGAVHLVDDVIYDLLDYYNGSNDAEAMAAKLEGVALTIGAKTSSTGTIFGSVTNIQVAEALAKAGFENIDRKIIYIKESVKEVGSYKAVLKLHKEVSVEVPFEVVSE
mgnify:CR=1 FL=1